MATVCLVIWIVYVSVFMRIVHTNNHRRLEPVWILMQKKKNLTVVWVGQEGSVCVK